MYYQFSLNIRTRVRIELLQMMEQYKLFNAVEGNISFIRFNETDITLHKVNNDFIIYFVLETLRKARQIRNC